MKRFLTLTTFLFILFSQSGCEKRIIDYRNKYVGNYSISTEIDTVADGNLTTEHVIYQGKVYYDKKGNEKDEIIIIYDEGRECKTTVDRKGTVTHAYHGGAFPDKKTFKIYFENAPNGTATTMSGTKN